MTAPHPVLGHGGPRPTVRLIPWAALTVDQRRDLLFCAGMHFRSAVVNHDQPEVRARSWRIWSIISAWAAGETVVCLWQSTDGTAGPTVGVIYREPTFRRVGVNAHYARAFADYGVCPSDEELAGDVASLTDEQREALVSS